MNYEKVEGIRIFTEENESFDKVVEELSNIKVIMDYRRIDVVMDTLTGEVIDYHDIVTALRVCYFLKESRVVKID